MGQSRDDHIDRMTQNAEACATGAEAMGRARQPIVCFDGTFVEPIPTGRFILRPIWLIRGPSGAWLPAPSGDGPPDYWIVKAIVTFPDDGEDYSVFDSAVTGLEAYRSRAEAESRVRHLEATA